MKVLVNGIGNIGQTLLNLLFDYKTLLNIDEVYALKNSEINDWNRNALDFLSKKGIKICTKNQDEFLDFQEIIHNIDYIFDCNVNSFGLKNKPFYTSLENLKGCSAQGSEKNFGISFMSGINNNVIKNEKFVHIVSCNTHAISSIITTFTNHNLNNLIEGDFVIVRRSEDLGNKERLVGANVLARHLNKSIGTHHAIDVKDLFATKNISLNIQSSDITTPSQLMHSVRFNLQLKDLLKDTDIQNFINKNPYVSKTSKFDSHLIFELGRRYSPYGRLYSQSIINDNNFLIDNENNRIKGWVFIPQEGNTILSTIHAFLVQTKQVDSSKIIEKLTSDLIFSEL